MSLADVIVGGIIIAVLIVGCTSVFGFVKDYLVDAENYYAANKFSMQTIEELQILDYTDSLLGAGDHTPTNPIPPPPYVRGLEACKLRDTYDGVRSYFVSENHWDAAETYHYKEIKVTTKWKYKGKDKSVLLVIFRRRPNET
jgi:hypothetical protein